VDEYVKSGRAAYVNDRIHLPNGQPIPFDGTRQGIRGSIDTWLTSQTTSVPAPAQVCSVFMWEQPPHFDTHNTSRIEEVVESHIIQVADTVVPAEDEGQEFSHDIFEVFTAEKTKPSKASELSAPLLPAQVIPPPTNTSATSPGTLRPNLQYRYQCDTEDFRLVTELEDFLLQGKLSLTTPAHVLAASSTIRKDMFNRLKVQRVETNEYEAVFAGDWQPSVAPAPVSCRTTVHNDTTNHSFIDNRSPDFCLPLQELDVLINGSIKATAILDTGSQIVVIRHDIAQALGAWINHQRLIKMEGANGATNWTVGCAKNLTLQVGDALIRVHAHIVKQASFEILLGRPFQKATLLCFEDLPSGDVEVSVCDPTNLSHRVYLSTHPCTGCVLAVKVISVCNLAPLPMPSTTLDATPPSFPSLPPTDPLTLVLKYKRVAQKV